MIQNIILKYSSSVLFIIVLKVSYKEILLKNVKFGLRGQDEGGRGSKKFAFVHAQGIKTVHAEGGGQKWQNYVHVVVEWPLYD